MTESKTHHFVSQCYLKGFTKNKGKKKPQVQVIDLKRGNMFSTSTENIAAENRFNQLEISGQKSNALEELLSRFEGAAASGLAQLRETRVLSHDCLDSCVCLMSLFAARSPYMRSNLSDIRSQLGNMMLSHIIADSDLSHEEKTGIKHDDLKKHRFTVSPTKHSLVEDEMKMVPHIASVLKKRNWILLDAEKSENFFVTSDRPVVLFRDGTELIHPMFAAAGFGVKNTIVHFPISPSLALHGTFEDVEYDPVDSDLVALFNHKTIDVAHTQIYFDPAGFYTIGADGNSHDQSYLLEFARNRKNKAPVT